MSGFTHLHVHTQFSILDGAAGIEALFEKAKNCGMKSLAITDHGNMYGVLKFIGDAKTYGIKPIIGCELYVARKSRFDKKTKEDRSGNHLILLAKNHTGYKNLSRLSSLGFLEGFYYTPRIDKELLKQYSEGLIALSACLGGEIPGAIINHGEKEAEKVLNEYLEIFGSDFYLEMQRNGQKEQDEVNKTIVKLASKYNVKVVATNDVHFINASDAEAHNILICLNTGKDIDEEKDMVYTGQEFLRTPEEMLEVFSDVPDALSNTQEVVDKIEVFDLTRKVILPVFPIPGNFSSESEYLHHLTYEGAKTRYPELNDEVKQRIEIELNIIKNMDFAGYFLIVQDFINEARKMGVVVGPGRGSVAGSIIAYCIGITNIDPIRYNLLFERFLNPERISMPDIDIDFDDYGREKVINYVVQKYGEKKVAQIITFGTMGAKSSIRDVARVLKLPLSESDKLAKLVPDGQGVTLKQAYKDVRELYDAKINGSQLVNKTLTFAGILEGSARHTGTHACGVIIGPDDLIEHIPLCTSKDSELMVTQYEGKLIEKVGMLKMDFLGLKTLTIIKDAVDSIYERHNVQIDTDNIPLDDKKTFELYQKGDTIGTFQFESEGMRIHLKNLKPNNIEELIAMNALYRPGPMEHIPKFISRKHGREKIDYPHPWLEEILKPTYGIMVYQEQIMQAAQILGGFSLGGADILRRAMGKKDMKVMEKQKEAFVKGAEKKGIPAEKALKIFEDMQEFGKYGFNRSHSAAYSVVAYQTAYLKAHYPAEYMAAVLTNNLSDIKKITFFIDECKKQGIQVLGPDINESELKFTVNKKGEIRFGLAAVKGVGEVAVNDIARERKENGPYSNIFDFTKRVNLRSVNKKCIEAMVYAGVFDNFPNTHRAQYFFKENGDETTFVEKIIKHTSNYKSREKVNQQSLFLGSKETEIIEMEIPECDRWTKIEQLRYEREVTGFYLSGHPLDAYRTEMENFCNVTITELNEDIIRYKDKPVKFAGMVIAKAHKTTKTGKPFGMFTLEDYTGSVSIPLFSEDYLKFKHFMEEGEFLFIKGKVQSKYFDENQLEIKIAGITLLSETIDKFTQSININLNLSEINKDIIKKFSETIKTNKGKCRLSFVVTDNEYGKISMHTKEDKVNSAKFVDALKSIPEINFKLE